MHVDLIGPYRKFIREQNPGGAIIRNNVSLTCVKTIDPATGCFDIVQIPIYDFDDVTGVNDEYIDKSSARVNQLFNSTWLLRYSRPRKVVFDNGYEFKNTSLL